MNGSLRTSLAIAALIGTALTGALGVTSSQAGEWRRGVYYPGYAVPAPHVVVYDAGPGIRPYWETPWQGRRYFPFTGKKPKVGRHEDLNAPSYPARPAPTYYQEWSTLSLYPPRAVMPPADITSYNAAPPVAPVPLQR